MIRINATRHHLNGVHTGSNVILNQHKIESWPAACNWAHELSCSPDWPEVVIELENCETGERLDLSRYAQRTKNEFPVEKILLELPEDVYKLEVLTPRRRKDD